MRFLAVKYLNGSYYVFIVMATSYREVEMKVEIAGYEAIEKKVKASGNSGRIYVPVQWVNCRVKLIRLDPIDCDE